MIVLCCVTVHKFEETETMTDDCITLCGCHVVFHRNAKTHKHINVECISNNVMLYFCPQTCMGKDVLLHVSITNPAMLLYQKFGFKCQELILNFYYKYFPLNCKESTHAFLMRLSR